MSRSSSNFLGELSLQGQRILLCVTGGIAAYKALEVVRRLKDEGAEVQVVMTEAATQFVTPLSFQALSGQTPRISLWDATAEAAMGHIELARWANQIVIAPATANTLAKLANGMADDLVTTLCLASAAPVLVAPAMNQQMWSHSATQANLDVLKQRGVMVIPPESGSQACGDVGVGRLAEPASIISYVKKAAYRQKSTAFKGLKVIINAGPTYEDIDPVRYLGNRSSGKMGFSIAASAAEMGAEVILVSGPVHLDTPIGVTRINVRSAQQMHQTILAELPADIFIAAAAVADYTPKHIHTDKIKKSDENYFLELTRTIDIVSDVVKQQKIRKLVVGFAAETQSIEMYAKQKLMNKGLDMVVANHVGKSEYGFESDYNQITAYWNSGEHTFPHSTKTALAEQLLELIEKTYLL